jgi:pimeloyl-ACP methyl ester carboxylesterase
MNTIISAVHSQLNLANQRRPNLFGHRSKLPNLLPPSAALHDYGGPVGFRIISAHPERLQTLIIQNAMGAKWVGIAQYWADPKAHPDVFDAFVSLAATRQRHTLGTSHLERYNPDAWSDEYSYLSRPGQREIQADLLYDYRTNVASYSAWQAWLREHKPPSPVVWGRNDPSFIAAGAEMFKHDLPDAETARRPATFAILMATL